MTANQVLERLGSDVCEGRAGTELVATLQAVNCQSWPLEDVVELLVMGGRVASVIGDSSSGPDSRRHWEDMGKLLGWVQLRLADIMQGARMAGTLSEASGQKLIKAVLDLVSSGATATNKVVPQSILDLSMESWQVLASLVKELLAICQWTIFCTDYFTVIGSGGFLTCVAPVKTAVREVLTHLGQIITAAAGGRPQLTYQDAPWSPVMEVVLNGCLAGGVLAADYINSKDSQVPREMRSFEVLNLYWTSLVKLLANPVLTPLAAPSVVQEALTRVVTLLDGELRGAQLAPDTKKVQVIRFWQQLLGKLVGTHAAAAASPLVFPALVDAAIQLHMCLLQKAGVPDGIRSTLEELVVPKMTAALLVALGYVPGVDENGSTLCPGPGPGQGAGGQKELISHRVSVLAPDDLAGIHDQEPQGTSFQGPRGFLGETELQGHNLKATAERQLLQARVLLICRVLLRGPVMSDAVREAAAVKLGPWLVMAAGVMLYDELMMSMEGDGGPCDLYPTVLQALLTFLLCCHATSHPASGPSAAATDSTGCWWACWHHLVALCVSPHPGVHMIVAELAAMVMQCADEEAGLQLVEEMGKVLGITLSLEAVRLVMDSPTLPGSPAVGHGQMSRGLIHVLRCMLLVLPPEVVSRGHHALLPVPRTEVEARGRDSLALAQSAGLWECFLSRSDCLPAGEVADWSGHVFMHLKQVPEILSHIHSFPHPHQRHLLLAHVAHVIALARVMVQACARKVPDASASLVALLVEVLQTAWRSMSQQQGAGYLMGQQEVVQAPQSRQGGMSGPRASSSGGAASGNDAWMRSIVVPCLAVIAEMDTPLPAATWMSLMPTLQGLLHHTACRPFLAVLVGQLGHVQPAPVDLFHTLLQDPHWGVHHLAMTSLVRYSRHPGSDFRSVIPPELLGCPPEGGGEPAFITEFKSFMQQRPDEPCAAAHKTSHASSLGQEHHQLVQISHKSRQDLASVLSAQMETLRLMEELTDKAATHEEEDAVNDMQVDPHVGFHQVDQLLTGSRQSLGLLLSALCAFEGDVSQLRHVKGTSLSPGEQTVMTQQVGHMLGELASAHSRLRTIQDQLDMWRKR